MLAIRPNAAMTSSSMLALLPALSPVLRKILKSKSSLPLSDCLTLSQAQTGLIVWCGTNPVAWIYPGYHVGQLLKEPKLSYSQLFRTLVEDGIDHDEIIMWLTSSGLQWLASLNGVRGLGKTLMHSLTNYEYQVQQLTIDDKEQRIVTAQLAKQRLVRAHELLIQVTNTMKQSGVSQHD